MEKNPKIEKLKQLVEQLEKTTNQKEQIVILKKILEISKSFNLKS